jgi:hypothetical protein
MAGNIGPENIGKGPSARFPRFACQFFQATSFCVMLPFEGRSVTVRYVSISTVLTFHRSRAQLGSVLPGLKWTGCGPRGACRGPGRSGLGSRGARPGEVLGNRPGRPGGRTRTLGYRPVPLRVYGGTSTGVRTVVSWGAWSPAESDVVGPVRVGRGEGRPR